jgi:predicted kinase
MLCSIGVFGRRGERDFYRSGAEALGAEVVLKYLDVPIDELRARVRSRNKTVPPGYYQINDSELDAWSRVFEPPGLDELAGNN